MAPPSSTMVPAWITVGGGITAIAQVVALGLMCVSMNGADLRVVRATADEGVSPFVVFKGLRVGSSSTCVTLHQVMNETGRWRTLETCNKLHNGAGRNLLSLRDAQTGERLTVDPICKAERDWLAEKMGIPSRVDIVSVWDKQCKNSTSFNSLLVIVSMLSFSLTVTLAVVTLAFDKTSDPWIWLVGITLPLIPVVAQAISLSTMSSRTSGPSFEVGATLKLSAWALGTGTTTGTRHGHLTSSNLVAPSNEAVAVINAAPLQVIMTALHASIDRINAALEAALAQPPPLTGTLRVCHATEDEWNAFADSSEHSIVRLNYLDWFADAEEIHIIEFDDAPHEDYRSALDKVTSFGTLHVYQWLKCYLAAKNSQGRRCSPDLSYGPRQATPHSVLPPNVPIFADCRTIKVEIGVSQQWGMAPGQLDFRAIAIWALTPGVEYVLCVKFDPNFANPQYKLYDVRMNPLVQLAPVPIVAPRTEIQFDGRRILGIPPGMALPVGFPASLSVDLYDALVWAMH